MRLSATVVFACLFLAGAPMSAQSGVDFGDAPESPPTSRYATTLAYTGAYHEIDVTFHLGDAVDEEPDGQPSDAADGDGADEDGVFWFSPLVAGRSAAIGVVASDAGRLNAWIDYDGDGEWQESAEQVLTGLLLEPGMNEIFFMVPEDAHPGLTYARFRFSRVAFLSPYGDAPDGEVEDYAIPIERYDFGDAFAPGASYPTALDLDGARHLLVPGVHLGESIDTELDAPAGPDASGDDGSNLDDEDGVFFVEPLLPGIVARVDVIASTQGFLQGWIDFNRDGNWGVGAERVFEDTVLDPGTNLLVVTVPGAAVTGQTYARFRFSTEAGMGVSGPAPDGEVEDHACLIELANFDYGDAPSTGGYPILRAINGAHHRIVEGIRLGATIDPDADGQPSAGADGDDLDADGDDEDGVSFVPPWLPGTQASVLLAVTSTGYLQAWFDFNADGDWSDASEHVFSNHLLSAGMTNLVVDIPATVSAPALTARFRFCTLPDVGVGGYAPDGEVEDYQIALAMIDCGDAPDTDGYHYPVRIADGGAYHLLNPAIYLGARIDADPDGQPSLLAVGDDSDADGNDDDGAVWLTPLRAGGLAGLRVTASDFGYLQGWIDFARDGDWDDPADRIIQNQALAAGSHLLVVPVPVDAIVGATFARFRFASSAGVGVGGAAADGEVEDYVLPLEGPVLPVPAVDPCAIWLQRPNGAYGIDVQSWMQPSLGAANARVVRAADDWPADGRPVTGARWWGSYINWTNNPAALPASSRPTSFRLTLYADALSTNVPFIPVPGMELATATVALLAFNSTNAAPGQATERLYGISQQGGFSTPGDFEYEYEYRAQFTNSWPVLAGRRYWLGIEAVVTASPTYRWGWCVASPHDAHDRNGSLRKSNESNWSAMTYPPNVFPWASATNHPDRGQPVELAFEVFSDECPRRAHQWPQVEDTVVPDGVPAWYRVGDAPSLAHVRADDFVADGRRIASVVWQGGYAGWASGVSGSLTNPVAPPAGSGRPLGFLLAWYATNGTACAPGTMVTNLFVPLAYCAEQFAYTSEQPWNGNERLHTYAYMVNLLDPRVSGEAWLGEANRGYWLSLQAVFGSGFIPGVAGHDGWLWQNAMSVMGCASVLAAEAGAAWSAGIIASPNPLAGMSLDLTFDLLTDSAGLSPLYDPPEIVSFGLAANGVADVASIGDLGSGVQVLQFASNLTADVWVDLATNRLPRELPYTNLWPGAQPPAGTQGALRILQR